ncbi:MAG: hypothetical protein BMS9Abin05_2375 [Rhodothermia bacterium]|nr:MAG: hypothetical protein BMS9Abin05_2375 [Rhodothermia bacterium]
MPTARHSIATSVANGKICAIGGSTGLVFSTVEEYDPATDTWTTKTSMPGPRTALSASTVNGKIYAIGGTLTAPPPHPGVKTVEEYTPLVVTSVEDPSGEQNNPMEFLLHQNYPNPFNPATVIVLSIPERDFVTLKVYDLLGNEIQTLVGKVLNAGTHSVTFDAGQFASGLYLYKLQSGELVKTRKMSLIR